MAQDEKLKPGAIKGEIASFTKTRNYGFCEFYVGCGQVGPITNLQYCNSTATSTGCPAETFSTPEPKKLAADLGASIVIVNPPKPTARKWCVVDELYVYAAGETHDFSGIEATWVAQMTVGDLESAAKAD